MSMRTETLVCCSMERHRSKMMLSTIVIIILINLVACFYHDPRHGNVRMGVSDKSCDTGKHNLKLDNKNMDKLTRCDRQRIPLSFVGQRSEVTGFCTDMEYPPLHVCMDKEIRYEEEIPLSGPHRPLWPVYGEYSYLPPQRWLHSLEHGAAVFLYHPCADQQQIDLLKGLARSCLRKHVITPYNLTTTQPFAIATWRCLLQVDRVDNNIGLAIDFLRKHALTALEKDLVQNGQYEENLVRPSGVPIGSDIRDSNICPFEALSRFYYYLNT